VTHKKKSVKGKCSGAGDFGLATMLWPGRSGGLNPGNYKRFFLLNVQAGSSAHEGSYSVDSRVLSSG